MGLVGALVGVALLHVQGVGACHVSGCPAAVNAVLISPGVPGVLGAECVAKLTAKQRGLVAKRDGVLHVHGGRAADMLPGVVKALSHIGQTLVGFNGCRNGCLEVQRVSHLSGAPLVCIPQPVKNTLGVCIGCDVI